MKIDTNLDSKESTPPILPINPKMEEDSYRHTKFPYKPLTMEQILETAKLPNPPFNRRPVKCKNVRFIFCCVIFLGLASILICHVINTKEQISSLRACLKAIGLGRMDPARDVADSESSLQRAQEALENKFEERKSEVDSEINALLNGLNTQQRNQVWFKIEQIRQSRLMELFELARQLTDKKIEDKLEETKKKLDDIALTLAEKHPELLGNPLPDEEADIFQNGTIVWKVANFSLLRSFAKLGIKTQFTSNTFSSNQDGYSFYLSIFPNGNDEFLGTHLSIYLHLTKGKMDANLKWPVDLNFYVTLMNQMNTTDDFERAMEPQVSRNLLRPNGKWTMGTGWADFISFEKLVDDGFLRNDEIVIKAVVDVEEDDE